MNLAATPANSLATALNTATGTSAVLNIYSGTQPATADTALSGNSLRVAITMSASAFGTVSTNVVTASGLPLQANATASGTAAFARLVTSGGTVIGDFAVATSGAEITINTVTITSGGPVQVTAFTITITK